MDWGSSATLRPAGYGSRYPLLARDGSELLLPRASPNPLVFISVEPPDPARPRPVRVVRLWWSDAKYRASWAGSPQQTSHAAISLLPPLLEYSGEYQVAPPRGSAVRAVLSHVMQAP
ncbi:hypothetical protein VPH35_007750 [Triticum aestivum]